MTERGGRWPAVGRAAALLLLLASCVPRPSGIAPLAGSPRSTRYLAQLNRRQQRAVMVEEAATIWPRGRAGCDTCPMRRLPGAQANLVFSWPALFRLRVDSVFGTAFDLGLAGDSLTVYAPALRAGVALSAVRDSLQVSNPGSLVVRLLTAAWRPPDAAWTRAAWEGASLVVRWSESGDSVVVAVDDRGRPAWARLGRDAGRGIHVAYERWETVDGVAWPVTLRVRSLGGEFELASRIARVKFGASADSLRLAVRIPDDADRFEPDRLRRLLQRVEPVR